MQGEASSSGTTTLRPHQTDKCPTVTDCTTTRDCRIKGGRKAWICLVVSMMTTRWCSKPMIFFEHHEWIAMQHPTAVSRTRCLELSLFWMLKTRRCRLFIHVKTRERRGSSFSQLGLEPNHTGLTAQSLFFLEESCRVKRSDTQTSSNFSNYFKRVLKLQKRSSSFSK